jgi:phosphatidylinositol-bisphosphatase
MLLPGELIEVHIEANINNDVASSLYHSHNVLDDILVVRLENGRDYFITVSGVHVTSCYGNSIEQLYHQSNQLKMDGKSRSNSGTTSHGKSSYIPSEIWRLINALYTKTIKGSSGMDTEGLFIESGDRTELSSIRNSLNSQTTISPSVSPHSLAEAILELLDSLADTIIPFAFYESISTLNHVSSSKQIITWTERFLKQLPTMNYNIFVYIIGFLKELLSHSNLNQLNVDILSTVFSSTFIRNSYLAKINNDKIIIESRKGMKIVLNYLLGGGDK